MNIGDKILSLRKTKGYSQEDIANKLNVSRQTVSKWETNQSLPDFDKIVPLCDLFGISTDELLKGITSENVSVKKEEISLSDEEKGDNSKKKFAWSLSVSIFLYFLSVMWIIFGETISIPSEINVVIFLGICGIATSIIVYASMTRKTLKNIEKEEKKNKKVETINNIMAMIFCVFYLVISFVTMAWHITWIMWIIYGVCAEIVKSVYELEDKDG